MEKEIISLEEFINEKKWLKCNINYKNNLFRASVYTTYGLEHCIWNDTGVKSIYYWKDELDITIEQLKQKLDEETQGISHCCCCGKPIYPGDKSEGYFAGVYCMNCWSDDLEKEREWDYSHLD